MKTSNHMLDYLLISNNQAQIWKVEKCLINRFCSLKNNIIKL